MNVKKALGFLSSQKASTSTSSRRAESSPCQATLEAALCAQDTGELSDQKEETVPGSEMEASCVGALGSEKKLKTTRTPATVVSRC